MCQPFTGSQQVDFPIFMDKVNQDHRVVVSSSKTKVSIVVPVYNEEEVLTHFVETVRQVLDTIDISWEMIFVNDGSTDRSHEILLDLHRQDSRIKFVTFARNFGNQIAMSAGIRYAQGDAVITMDADLQHPPDMISEMIKLWKDGYHCVNTIRNYGQEISPLKKKTSQLFGKVFNHLSDIPVAEGLSDFRLLDRKIVDYLNSMHESSRFLRIMISWLGFRQIDIHYTAEPRIAGKTKFSLMKLLKLSIDGITSFSVKPLRWSIYFGTFIAVCSLFFAMTVLHEVYTEGIITPGWPTLIVTILFLGGVQLISIGVLGEYIGRIFIDIKQRPLFVVQEEHGFLAQDETVPISSAQDHLKAA